MKLLVSTLVAASLLALPALADDCQSSCSTSSCSSKFACENECPLAQDANARRAFGAEAVLASKVVRSEFASELERNLARV